MIRNHWNLGGSTHATSILWMHMKNVWELLFCMFWCIEHLVNTSSLDMCSIATPFHAYSYMHGEIKRLENKCKYPALEVEQDSDNDSKPDVVFCWPRVSQMCHKAHLRLIGSKLCLRKKVEQAQKKGKIGGICLRCILTPSPSLVALQEAVRFAPEI